MNGKEGDSDGWGGGDSDGKEGTVTGGGDSDGKEGTVMERRGQ